MSQLVTMSPTEKGIAMVDLIRLGQVDLADAIMEKLKTSKSKKFLKRLAK